MRLASLKIRQFKALTDAVVPLAPFTVLVGPNGAGKSTILQAIDLLGGIVRGSIGEFLSSHGWEYSDLPHLKSRDSRMAFVALFDCDNVQLEWSVTLGARRYPGIAQENVIRDRLEELLKRDGRSMSRYDEGGHAWQSITQTLPSSWLSVIDASDQRQFPSLLQIARWARGVRAYFFLDPVKLRDRGRSAGTDIGRHGEALAPFLAHLRDRDRPAFQRLVQRVQRHYPRLEGIVPKRKGFGWAHLELRERWNSEIATFNARQVSDGLLRLVAVSAMYELPGTPSVLLLDEVENGLHPHLLGGFVHMLQALASTRGVQVIVATHSPVTLNYVDDPSSVIVVSRTADGRVQFTPFHKTRRFEKLRRHFDLGELWYNVGEEKLVR